jgi:hypothetical protein
MEPRPPQPHDRDYPDKELPYPRHDRHRPPSPVGHWTRTIGALLPLVIGELVKEPEKKWRFIRVASVAMAVINEASYAYQVQKERTEREQERRER